MKELLSARETVNQWMQRFGVRFGVYKNGVFNEQLFPFDAIPRRIEADEWKTLEAGLCQRVKALNAFLYDIYHEKRIVADGVVPKEFAYESKGYMPECDQITPTAGVYAHIAGIDLVQAKDGRWLILEDNLRIPSGASYPMIARTVTRKASPQTFRDNMIEDNRNYGDLLRNMMDFINDGRGINVIFTPGRYNSAFFEHSYLAEKTQATLAFPGELVVEDGKVFYLGIKGKSRVGAIYRRVSDEYLDPLAFEPSSLLGVPNLMEAYRAGEVGVINALGNGVADDKGIYYFVPKMVEYYLAEKPLLQNAPTYLPFFKQDYEYILDNIGKLVIKDVAEAGGYGVMFGKDMSADKIEEMRRLIAEEPRRWIAQEVVDFIDLDIIDETGSPSPRKCDLRAFVITGSDTVVWKSGLTRFSRNADSFVVNSSQGGGFKDTWVMA